MMRRRSSAPTSARSQFSGTPSGRSIQYSWARRQLEARGEAFHVPLPFGVVVGSQGERVAGEQLSTASSGSDGAPHTVPAAR